MRGTNGRSLDRRFAANAAVMRAHVEDLRDKVAVIREGGGAAARRRHLGRGKPLPRERVRALLDPNSSFLELSQLVAYGRYDGGVFVTGIGQILGRECAVVANDAVVKSGAGAHRGLNRASMMAQVAMALAAVVNGPHSA